jgi:putative transcriptional regulator
MKNSVREERERLGLTQQELAELVSVSRQTIYALEIGKYIPSTILALKIAKQLDSSVEEIFVLEKGD